MLICTCVRPLATNRTRTFRLDAYQYEPDPTNYGFFERQEKDLLSEVLQELAKYDLLIGHNIDGFDLGFLRTRAQRFNVPFFMNPFTYDTMKAFRRIQWRTVLNRIGKPTASLAMIADFLGVKQEKTAVYPVEWWGSIWGKEAERMDAMNNIVDHCSKDVRMNAQVYELMLPHDMKARVVRWL